MERKIVDVESRLLELARAFKTLQACSEGSDSMHSTNNLALTGTVNWRDPIPRIVVFKSTLKCVRPANHGISTIVL